MEQPEEKNVRSLAESVLFYAGIPAALLYPLGVLAVGIQLWLDPLFPYVRLDTVWIAVSLIPERVVIGTGIRLLLFALLSTAFAIGVSVLLVRGWVRVCSVHDNAGFYSTLLGGTSFWQPHAIGEPPCNAASLQVWRAPGRAKRPPMRTC